MHVKERSTEQCERKCLGQRHLKIIPARCIITEINKESDQGIPI